VLASVAITCVSGDAKRAREKEEKGRKPKKEEKEEKRKKKKGEVKLFLSSALLTFSSL
jgi:hypothetical protein